MYRALVERKGRTRFNFQYVPQVGKKTGKENHQLALSQKQSLVQSLLVLTSLGPIELFFLSVILVHALIVILASKYFSSFV